MAANLPELGPEEQPDARLIARTVPNQWRAAGQLRNTAAEMGVDFDADAVAEAARNITAADDEPEGRNRKERRWFGKKKK